MADSIIVELQLKNGEYIANITKAKNATKKATKDMQDGFMGLVNSVKAFMSLSITQSIISYARSFATFANECINASERLDDLRKQLENMTGSAEGTRQVMSEMRAVISTGVFDNLKVEDATRQLILAGETTDRVGQTLNNLANYAAATGQEIDTVTASYARMSTTGDVTWRTIRAFGVPVLQQLAKDLYGSETATNRVRNALDRGTITFSQFRTALNNLTTANGRFANSLASEARDADAAINRIGIAWGRLKAWMGENIFGPAVVDFDNFLTHIQQSETVFGGYLDSLSEMATRYGAIGEALSRVINLMNWQERAMTEQRRLRSIVMQGPMTAFTALQEGMQNRPPEVETDTTRGGRGGESAEMMRKRILIAKAQADQEEQQRQQDLVTANKNREVEMNNYKLEQAQQTYNALTGMAQNFASMISGIQQQELQNKLQSIDNEYEQRKAYIEANVTDEKERAKQLAALELERNAKVRKEKRKAAKEQKEMSIFQTLMNMLTGAMAAYQAMAAIPIVGPALGGIAAAAVMTFGGIMINKLNKQPLPELYQGGIIKGTPQGTPVIVGEKNQTEVVTSLDNLKSMLGSRIIQVVVDGKVLTEVVDNGRSKKAYGMGARNYSYGGVYK